MSAPVERDFEGNAELLRVLGHSVRLQILCAIKDHELAVGTIEEVTGIGQPSLSQQLAVLRKADLVTTRREGKQIFYRVNSEQILGASDLLDALAGTGSINSRPPIRTKTRADSGGGASAFAKVLP